MKKLIIMAASVTLAAIAHAAAVGWTLSGASAYAGDAYQFFVIGQNGTESVSAITALLDAGTSLDSYAFGSGTIANNGAGTMTAAASGQTLGSGSYEAFFVVFDSASPTAGSSNYAVVSGVSTLSKTVSDTSATVMFTTGNQSTFLNNTSNWKSFGTSSSVPEPTSGLLMLLGMAGLALRRKRA